MNVKDVSIPDGYDTAITTIDGKIVFVTVEQDEDVRNPCEECDGIGMVHSFSHRHFNFLKLSATCQEDAMTELKEMFGSDFVTLGYFEHGRCDWHVSGHKPLGTEGDYRWDGVSFAGVWVPDTVLKQELGKSRGGTRRRMLEKFAAQACKVYTAWCNGDVSWYSVSCYKKRGAYDKPSDYRHDDALFHDSCGGFYWDSPKEVTSELTSIIEQMCEEVNKDACKLEGST